MGYEHQSASGKSIPGIHLTRAVERSESFTGVDAKQQRDDTIPIGRAAGTNDHFGWVI
jgi:hypothetical protein